MSSRHILCTVLLFMLSVLVASGIVPGHPSGGSIERGALKVSTAAPPFAVRNGPLGLLQRRWLETMYNLPLEVPHPLNASNPACLNYPVQGVRLLTGDFSGNGTNKTCTVSLNQDLFLSVSNIPASFVVDSSSDRALGYPANPRSAAVFLDAFFGVCKRLSFLVIDGTQVNVASYYDVPNPAVFNTPMNTSYLNLQQAFFGIYGGLPPQPSVIAYGSGTYILFRFTRIGTYTITYGADNCVVDSTTKTRQPFTWVYYDKDNVKRTTEFTDLTHFRDFNNLTSNEIETFAAANWTMDITVTN